MKTKQNKISKHKWKIEATILFFLALCAGPKIMVEGAGPRLQPVKPAPLNPALVETDLI